MIVLAALIISLSFSSVRSQNIRNQVYQRAVTVEPPEGACGVDASRSTVAIDKRDLFGIDSDNPPERVKCATQCGRKYPQTYNTLKIEGTEGDGQEFGNPNCKPVRTLTKTTSFENRRKRATAEECVVMKNLPGPSSKWSYSLWIKPDTNVTMREMTVFQHNSLRLTVQLTGNDFTAKVYWTDNGAEHTFKFPTGEWTWVAIQFEEGVGGWVYHKGGSSGSTFGQNKQYRPNLQETTTIHVGASPQTSENCELLQMKQCREAGYSQMVEKGSQSGSQPDFPNYSQCQSLTANERIAITTYFCASLYPACDDQGNTQTACPSLCQEAVDYLSRKCPPQLLQNLSRSSAMWKCQNRKKRQALQCIRRPRFNNNIYKGIIRDFQIYPSLLTTRQLIDAVNAIFPSFHPNKECMCTEDFPVSAFYSAPSHYCYPMAREQNVQMLNQKLRLDVALPENTQFFSSQYITDGWDDPRDGIWVSTPGLRKVSLVIDFKKVIKVNDETGSVRLILATSPPEGALVIHRFWRGVWREWYYFAGDCTQHGLPENGIPTTPDAIKCDNYDSVLVWQNTEYKVIATGRPGRYGNIVDKRLEEYFLMERIKVEFRGIPQNTENSGEKQFHAVVELQVEGRDYDDTQRCNIQCFPADWGYVSSPFGRSTGASGVTVPSTTPGSRVDYRTCQCRCREPFDRTESGPNCVPYISDVHPNYGPVIGGTAVTLTGALLGNQRPSVTLRSEAVAVQCLVTSFNDTRIECTTNRTLTRVANSSFYVQVGQANSRVTITAKELFVYKPDPEISQVHPLVSIVNGGVRLTVEGQNLDSVENPQMRLRIEYNKSILNYTEYKTCSVKNSTVMYCPTPNIYPYLPPEYQRRLNTDNTELDPSGNRIARSVQLTQSLLSRVVAKWLSSFGLVERKKRSAEPAKMEVTDELLRTFPEIKQDNKKTSVTQPLTYVANPPIDEWDPPVRAFKPHWPHKETSIAIDGKRMNEGADVADYHVFVGDEECLVTDLISNLLTCHPPQFEPRTQRTRNPDSEPNPSGLKPSQPEPKSHDDISTEGTWHVWLRIGPHHKDAFKKSLGYLEYQPWWKSIEFIGITTAAVSLLILGLIVCCLCRKCSRKDRKENKPKEYEVYYVDAESEVSILTRINSHLLRSVEKSLLKDPEKLQIHKQIGSGNFGKVYSGQFAQSKKAKPIHVAVKTLRGGQDVDQIEEFLEEALMMENFKHPNIISILGVTFKNNTPYVILPFMTNGDLRSYTRMPTTILHVSDLVIFSAQIAKGMAYLEQKRFIHRDLAARNCMVDLDKTVKVSDFGLARDIYVDDYYKVEDKSRPLPVRWMALESLEQNKFTHKSDVWSFGVVMWELMTRGRLPYSGIDNLDIKRLLKRGDRLEKTQHTPSKVYSIMTKCWAAKPQNRPKFSELVTKLDSLLGKTKGRPKQIKSSQDYVNIPSDYLTPVDAPTEENILNAYNRYSRC